MRLRKFYYPVLPCKRKIDVNLLTEPNKIPVNYDRDKDLIIIGEQSFTPDYFLDVLDECLLLRIRKIKALKITKLDELIKKNEQYEKDIDNAETKMDVSKIRIKAKIIDRVRYSVKLLQMEEDNIRNEMLGRGLPEETRKKMFGDK